MSVCFVLGITGHRSVGMFCFLRLMGHRRVGMFCLRTSRA